MYMTYRRADAWTFQGYGVIRDVVQNHLTQILVLSLMDVDIMGTSGPYGDASYRKAVLQSLVFNDTALGEGGGGGCVPYTGCSPLLLVLTGYVGGQELPHMWVNIPPTESMLLRTARRASAKYPLLHP
jgi:hypothetical protein